MAYELRRERQINDMRQKLMDIKHGFTPDVATALFLAEL